MNIKYSALIFFTFGCEQVWAKLFSTERTEVKKRNTATEFMDMEVQINKGVPETEEVEVGLVWVKKPSTKNSFF